MAKLKDIADHSGFSIRTVNRVLKKEGIVNEKTRETILQAARQLNYIPNLAARALKSGRSQEVIAVINSCDEIHLRKYAALEKELRCNELLMSTFIVEDDKAYIDLVKRLSLSPVAGVVLMADYYQKKQLKKTEDLWLLLKGIRSPVSELIWSLMA